MRILFAALFSLLTTPLALVGQEMPAPAVATPAPSPSAPAQVAPERAGMDFREQSIYIPYDKLWKVFEAEGRGVFIPYAEFDRLWTAARSNLNTRVEHAAPVGAILKEAGGVIRVGREVVEAEALLRVELLKAGWHELPIGLADVGVTLAEVDGKPARLLSKEGQGYFLLLEKKEGAPVEALLKLGFSRAYEKTPGRNQVAFQPPPAAVSRWEVVIPEPGVKALITPQLAVSEAPAASTNETRVVAVVGAAPQVTIQWTPRAEGAVGLEALVNLQTESDTEIDEGVCRTRLTLKYTISRAKLAGVDFEVPGDQKVVAVADPNVKEWRIEAAGGTQRVKVDFFEPATGSQTVVAELEAYGTAETLSIPVARAAGVARQQGRIGVRVSPRLRAEPISRAGLTQVDEATLARPLKGGTYPFAFQYAKPDGVDLRFALEAVKPRVTAESSNAVRISPDRVVQDVIMAWKIEKTGLFKLQARLPEGFELESVKGLAGEGGAAPVVESQFVDKGLLTLNLAGQAIGIARMNLVLVRKLTDAALLQPGGGDVKLVIPLARVAEEGVESQKRLAQLTEDPALWRLKVEPQGLDFKGANDASPEIVENKNMTQRGFSGGWLFRGHADASMTVTLRRRAPYISAGQMLVAEVEGGRVKFLCTLHYTVSYSGVKQFRLDVPEALAGQIKPAGVNLSVRPATPDELTSGAPPAGYIRLVIEGDREFIGKAVLPFEWNQTIGELPVGKSQEITLPRLIPRGVEHAWGQIALKKAEAIDLTPVGEPAGLRPIDPERDLMEGLRIPGVAQAYEYRVENWALALKATRYEVADVKNTSVERGVVRHVLTRAGTVSAQALFRMRSARQRLALKLPEGAGFDTQPARINGAAVPLERGPSGEYFVPLTGRSPDDAFVLELRYTLASTAPGLAIPEFTGESAVQKVLHSIYLPPDRRHLGFGGPWSDENVWVLFPTRIAKRANRSADAMIEWVAEGVNFDRSSLSQFATDGTHLLFSALRPEPGPAGVLRPRSMKGWVLDLLVIAAMMAAGLPLLRASPRRVAAALAAAACAWTLGMVFAPELAGAMINKATAAAGIVLIALWTVRELLTGNWLRRIARRPKPPLEPPPPSAPEGPAPSLPAGAGV